MHVHRTHTGGAHTVHIHNHTHAFVRTYIAFTIVLHYILYCACSFSDMHAIRCLHLFAAYILRLLKLQSCRMDLCRTCFSGHVASALHSAASTCGGTLPTSLGCSGTGLAALAQSFLLCIVYVVRLYLVHLKVVAVSEMIRRSSEHLKQTQTCLRHPILCC
jgi:hypothetical protein